jgi:hypothetical protein
MSRAASGACRTALNDNGAEVACRLAPALCHQAAFTQARLDDRNALISAISLLTIPWIGQGFRAM